MSDNNSQIKDTVLFLGTGATAGSGIKKNCRPLPTDNSFFCKSSIASKQVNSGDYPALKIVRENYLAELAPDSLYRTWNAIFILRGLGGAGIIKFKQDVISKYNDLANHNWQASYDFQKKHYWYFFKTCDFVKKEYNLCELAIWDLRVLVKEVYSDSGISCPARKFWEDLKFRVSGVVNFNYDTTFDDSIPTGDFYYPGDDSPKRGIPIIRPHGSLKWSSRSRYSPEKRWSPWDNDTRETKLYDMGFKNGGDFSQPLIVPPAFFKEEVVGNSSMPGLTGNNILHKQWDALQSVLSDSKIKHWIFYGFSFASGDDHLVLMMQKALQNRGHEKCITIHFSQYGDNNEICHKIIDLFGEHVCKHHVNKGQTIEKFLSGGYCGFLFGNK